MAPSLHLPPSPLPAPPSPLASVISHIVCFLRSDGPEPASDADAAATAERPPFPPPTVRLLPALPPDLSADQAGQLLTVWTFTHSFHELLGLWPSSLGALLEALVLGEQSPVLGALHMSLLRLLQADMEEHHLTVSRCFIRCCPA